MQVRYEKLKTEGQKLWNKQISQAQWKHRVFFSFVVLSTVQMLFWSYFPVKKNEKNAKNSPNQIYEQWRE